MLWYPWYHKDTKKTTVWWFLSLPVVEFDDEVLFDVGQDFAALG
jgi:hypothetical protein